MPAMTDDELKHLFDAMRQELAANRQENAQSHAETRRHFDIVTEGTRQEIRQSRVERLKDSTH